MAYILNFGYKMGVYEKKRDPYVVYSVFQFYSRLDKWVCFRCISGDADGAEMMYCCLVIRNLLGVILNVISNLTIYHKVSGIR
jgi:hypothetical protein